MVATEVVVAATAAAAAAMAVGAEEMVAAARGTGLCDPLCPCSGVSHLLSCAAMSFDALPAVPWMPSECLRIQKRMLQGMSLLQLLQPAPLVAPSSHRPLR